MTEHVTERVRQLLSRSKYLTFTSETCTELLGRLTVAQTERELDSIGVPRETYKKLANHDLKKELLLKQYNKHTDFFKPLTNTFSRQLESANTQLELLKSKIAEADAAILLAEQHAKEIDIPELTARLSTDPPA